MPFPQLQQVAQRTRRCIPVPNLGHPWGTGVPGRIRRTSSAGFQAQNRLCGAFPLPEANEAFEEDDLSMQMMEVLEWNRMVERRAEVVTTVNDLRQLLLCVTQASHLVGRKHGDFAEEGPQLTGSTRKARPASVLALGLRLLDTCADRLCSVRGLRRLSGAAGCVLGDQGRSMRGAVATRGRMGSFSMPGKSGSPNARISSSPQ